MASFFDEKIDGAEAERKQPFMRPTAPPSTPSGPVGRPPGPVSAAPPPMKAPAPPQPALAAPMHPDVENPTENKLEAGVEEAPIIKAAPPASGVMPMSSFGPPAGGGFLDRVAMSMGPRPQMQPPAPMDSPPVLADGGGPAPSLPFPPMRQPPRIPRFAPRRKVARGGDGGPRLPQTY